MFIFNCLRRQIIYTLICTHQGSVTQTVAFRSMRLAKKFMMIHYLGAQRRMELFGEYDYNAHLLNETSAYIEYQQDRSYYSFNVITTQIV